MEFLEDVFDGPAEPMPLPIGHGSVQYVAKRSSASCVRHVEGYGVFLQFAAEVHATQTRPELSALIHFIRDHGERTRAGPKLRSSAAIFIGNLLISLRPDPFWRAYKGGSPTAGNRALAFEVDFLVEGVCEGDDTFVDHHIDAAERWAAF
jgi:hypothetical protein